MAFEHSVNAVNKLTERFRRAKVHRPMRMERYEAGAELVYDVTGVVPPNRGRIRLLVEDFVGGGFAGQVYRARITEIDTPQGAIDGLGVGTTCAIKILIPPSNKARLFRDLIYGLGFQGPFAPQVNIAASRAGALWWKFIRRAGGVRFGDESTVVDVFATFVDQTLGGCGEISEWIEGRTWRFEVDDRLFARWRWKADRVSDGLGSPEYRAKKAFMGRFVALLHEMGAHEFARQYEWWTCKSQPNVLKRLETGDNPETGLTAVDFRAGLALLPFLPMSPGDVPLILKGLARGSLVQFDRGDVGKLGEYIDSRPNQFAEMRGAFEELRETERRYRDSQIDITHNHVRLLRPPVWATILDSAVGGWRVRNIIDDAGSSKLRNSRFLAVTFLLTGLLPALGVGSGVAVLIAGLLRGAPVWGVVGYAAVLTVGVPLLVRKVRRLWGRADYRRDAWAMMSSFSYLRRAFEGRVAEMLIRWIHSGRIDGRRALKIADHPWTVVWDLPLSLLPSFAHRMLTDARYAMEKLRYVVVRPIRLYFRPAAREQWLREMVAEGKKRHMLTDEDADRILSRIRDPFIQKYLKSLAVHVCTLPVTQIVSVAVAGWYYFAHPEMPTDQRSLAVAGILILFQIIPLSPGSLVRGGYVLYLVLRERNFRDYNIAVFLGFFKYVGYLAFPIQMAYRYPALARFMAGHWATGAVHVVPVFGEHGALLEHGVFDMFYNYPLTVRRRMRRRAELRAGLEGRSWHAVPIVFVAVAALTGTAAASRAVSGALPTLGEIWPLALLLPLTVGVLVTLGAGGTTLGGRIRLVIISAVCAGAGYALAHAALALVPALGGGAVSGELLSLVSRNAMWSVFLFALLSVLGGLLTEINLPEPRSPGPLEGPQEPESQQELAGDVGVETGDQIVDQDAPPAR